MAIAMAPAFPGLGQPDSFNVRICGPPSKNKNMYKKSVKPIQRGQPLTRSIVTSRPCKEKSLVDKNGESQLEEAMCIFRLMNTLNISVDDEIYANLLQGCARTNSIREGTRLHAHITKMGLQPSLLLANNLVNMYVKCGKLFDARLVFDKMPKRDKVSWSAMISGYAENGFAEEALKFYFRMRAAGMKPNHFTFVGVLQACTCLGDLKLGGQVHAWIVKMGFGENVYLGSALVHHYSICASIKDARKVFDEMPERDVVLWTAMIAGYAGRGHAKECLDLFNQMRLVGVEPSEFTFPSVLRACTCLGGIKHGEGIHAYAIKIGVESDAFVGSALVDMYGKCGSLVDARRVFNEIPERDGVLWNAMISGCLQWGCDKEALVLLNRMKSAGLKLDEFLIISLEFMWNQSSLARRNADESRWVENRFCSKYIPFSELFLLTCIGNIIAHVLADKMPK